MTKNYKNNTKNVKNTKKNKEERRRRSLIILLLIILLLGVTVGYAVLSTSLNINGTSRIKNSGWDVHFENVQVVDGSVAATVAPTIDSKQLDISYEIELTKPGQFYEFTVDVCNKGYIDAILRKLPILKGVSNEQDVYINYTFAHADGTAIRVGEKLMTGETQKFRVRVEADRNVIQKELPVNTQKLYLSVVLNYEQA